MLERVLRNLCRSSLLVAAAIAAPAAAADERPTTAPAVPPNIKITDFRVTRPAEGKVKAEITAVTEGDLKIGCYTIQIGDRLPDRTLPDLPGFVHAYDKLYLAGDDYGDKYERRLQKDNGQNDEDPRDGVFAYTIDTTKWPEGRYYITVNASNSPNPGPYYVTSRIFHVDVGQPNLVDMDENVPGAKHTVIWRKEDVYACFPSLRRLEDGRLVTRFGTKTRASHIDPTGGSLQMVSSDGGYAWAINNEKFPDTETKTADGRMVYAHAEGWVHVPESEKPVHERERRTIMGSMPGKIAYLSPRAFVQTSTDGGKTWEKKPIDVPDDVLGMLTFAGMRTKSGMRIVSVYGPRDDGADNKNPENQTYFLRSEDDGKTWEFIYQTPDGLKNSESPAGGETTVHELPNGELLAMTRAADKLNMFTSISSDAGKTWSAYRGTGFWGHPPDLVNLPDGRVLCVYGYRRAPMGIRACISNDNGRTWDVANELRLRTDAYAAWIGDLGYPKITLLPNGELFTIYYIATDGKMPYIAGTHFRVPPTKSTRGTS